MSRLRYCAVAFMLILAVGLGYARPVHAAASPPASCPASGCLDNSITHFPAVYLQSGLTSVITILSFIAGILSVVFLILGGIHYATSSGDAARVKSARQTILFAVIGLAISIVAPLIVGFVVARGPN